MTEQARLIEFHSPVAGSGMPQPVPMSKVIPPWFKQMTTDATPISVNGPIVGTVKACPPFLDAMSCGYALPLICDVKFFMRSRDVLEFHQELAVIKHHPPSQVPGAPFAGKILIKITNPWIVKTPPGYSTLFVSLLNHFTMPFHVLAGLVETDTYYLPVHFPAICLMEPGQYFTLMRGTPVVQAIPIRRESWGSTFSPVDAGTADSQMSRLQENRHFYKDLYRVKKEYR